MNTKVLSPAEEGLKELHAKLQILKKERNALILAHNYQLNEVQDVADYVGDSYYLSKVVAERACDVIVFCGVRFMAETAAILSPEREVLLPEPTAACPLADMISASDVRALKSRHPGAPVVCYINSTAEVKAESDICCTSANAVRIVAALPAKKVIFVPDENLGQYVARQLPDKEIVLWPGHCPVHAGVSQDDVRIMREKYPAAEVMVHPECRPEVLELADFVGSTADILRRAELSDAQTLVIGTEVGVLHSLKRERAERQAFILQPGLVCPNMKKTRLQHVYDALKQNRHRIEVAEPLRESAKRAISRMLEMAG